MKQEAALKEVLEPQQLQRLRQIELQSQGPRAFHESYAVEELKLNAEQRRQIRNIKDETMEILRGEKGGPGDNSGNIFKAEVERIVKEVLTPQQQAKWQELSGPASSYRRPPPPKGDGRPPKEGPGGRKPPPGPFGIH